MAVLAKADPDGSNKTHWFFQRALTITVSGLFALVLLSPSAFAQSLGEVLMRVNETNPELMAERESVKQAEESIAIAKGERLPQAEASGTGGVIDTDIAGIDTGGTSEAYSVGLRVSKPLYTGGRINAAIRAATSMTNAAVARIEAKEQSIFLETVTAYMDVIRDEPILALNRRNISILKKRLAQIEDLRKSGRATLTDIREMEALIAGAEAEEIQARGNLQASRSAFERLVGIVPGTLIAPTRVKGLPTSEEQATQWAADQSPVVIAAQHAARAAADNVQVERGARLPEVGLEGFALYGRSTVFNSGVANLLTTDDDFRGIGAVVRVRIPLFQGGKISAKTRRAEAQASQRELQSIAAHRSVRDGVIRAWQALETAKSVMRARQAQIAAAELALEGIRLENSVGRRTNLDVLDAEQKLLDAQVMEIKAKRDWLVASYSVLAAIGRLTAKDLGLQAAEISRRSVAVSP